MAKRAYETTAVPVAKSQDELRGLLRKFGADQFSFGEGPDWAGLEFVHGGQMVRVRCPLRTMGDAEVSAHRAQAHVSRDAAAIAVVDREAMRVWRVLVWSTKARLVAVDEGLETFEQAFLSHLVDPGTDRTLWQIVQEPIEAGLMKLGAPGLPALGTGR